MSGLIYVGGGLKLDFLGSYWLSAGGTSHSFDDIDLGSSSASGLLVLAAAARGASSNLSGASVNGNATTQVALATGANGSAALYQITGVGGIGDVVLSSGNAPVEWGLGVYKIRGLRDHAVYDIDDDDTGALSLDVLSGGLVIGAGMGVGGSSTGITWDALNRNFNDNTPPLNSQFSAASQIFDTAQTPLSITATNTNTYERYVAGSWR